MREAAALAAQLASSQPGSTSAPGRSRRPSSSSVVNPNAPSGLGKAEPNAQLTADARPPVQEGGHACAANGAAKAGGEASAVHYEGEVRPTVLLTQLQLNVSELLAANQRLRQENMEMLREIFPCASALHRPSSGQ